MDLKNKNVLLIGAGTTGISVMRFLKRHGARVILFDEKKKEDFKDTTLQNIYDFADEVYFETIADSIIDKVDLYIISPGVSLDKPYVTKAFQKGIEVISEIELAYRYCKSKNIIAITGTNGKTTTTTLVGEILKGFYDDVVVCGNIGNPFIDYVEDHDENTIYVIEVSSFQLETIKYFKPHVAAILNITPDHLNRHKSMENYIRSKMRIFENMDQNDYTVLNLDNDITKGLQSHAKGNVILFSKQDIKYNNCVCVKSNFVFTIFDQMNQSIIKKDEIFIPGEHNLENCLAAIGCVLPFGVEADIIAKTLKEFKGVEHRIEFVREINGVKFYNDSKGTNTDASIKALSSFNTPIILIAGGYDKGEDFTEFAKMAAKRSKKVILMGSTKEKIADKLKSINYFNFEFAKNLEDAVKRSFLCSSEGDVVLLSPACASWDMFENYEQRGRLFKQYVNEL